MSITTGTFPGVRIVDMPDLGVANDASSVVGERAGSGRFGLPAVRNYIETTGKLGATISVKDYGAVGNGVADDTAAIQAAMDAGAARGGSAIMFPVGNYRITASLNIGNGTSAAVSTKAGVVLVGEGAPPITGFWGGYTLAGSTCITWAGGAGPMINVYGPIQGWGVKSLALMGGGGATVGISVVSGQFGDCQNLLISNCTAEGIGSTTVAPFGGNNTDSLHNSWRDIAIQCPISPGVKGIVLSGAGPVVNSDTGLNLFENIMIALPGTGTAYGIYLQNCDTNHFMAVHLAGGNAACIGIMLDYTAETNGVFPCGNSFFGLEANGDVLGANQFVNAGTPGINARPNFIHGLAQANGSTNPSLANLDPDLPVRVGPRVFLLNQTASLGSTNIYESFAAGVYRVSLYLALQNAGNAVTVTASIGYNDAAPRVLTTQPINFSTGANNPQTMASTVINGAFQQISYSTAVSGAPGAGTYMLAIVIERLS